MLRWYLVVQAWAIPFHSLASYLFRDLPDRGYAFSKFLGLLTVSLATWLAFAWLGAPFKGWTLWFAWLAAAISSLAVGFQSRRTRFLSGIAASPGNQWRNRLTAEILFLCVYAGWCWVVAHDPGIEHTEQPMDFMFLAGLWNTEQFPPQDPWLAGYPVSYYYFGFWLIASLAKASHLPPSLAYNLGLATWYAFLCLGVYGLAFNAAQWLGSAGGFGSFRVWKARFAAGLSTAAVAVMGTLSSPLELLYAFGLVSDSQVQRLDIKGLPERASRTQDFLIDTTGWWWWRSTRVIHDRGPDGLPLEVITEFPFFSYFLGDSHPHVLAAPILQLAAGLLLQALAGSAQRAGVEGSVSKRRPISDYAHAALGMLLVAAALLTSYWDGIAVLALSSASVALLLRHRGIRPSHPVRWIPACGLALFAAAFLVSLPHQLLLQSPVQGIQINLFNPTRWPQFLLFWGPLLSGCAVATALAAERGLICGKFVLRGLAIASLSAVTLLGVRLLVTPYWIGADCCGPDGQDWRLLAIDRWAQGLPTLAILVSLVSFCLSSLFLSWKQLSRSDGRLLPFTYLTGCAGLACLLIFLAELVYVHDGFGPLMRMNTVFKFYYQAWPLLGVVFGVAGAAALSSRLHAFKASGILLLILLAVCLHYPVATVAGRIQSRNSPLTLNARQAIEYSDPDLAAALDWVDTNVEAHQILLEAPGLSYRPDHNRFSSLTGRPTLHGWDRHELHWRGGAYAEMAGSRRGDACLVYGTGSTEQILGLLETWQVQFVAAGPSERELCGYGESGKERLEELLTSVFEAGPYQIFRVPA